MNIRRHAGWSFVFFELAAFSIIGIAGSPALGQSFDLGISSISHPAGTIGKCDSTAPVVTVRNAGSAASPTASLFIVIMRGSAALYGPVTQSFGPISAGDTLKVQFNPAWLPTDTGSFDVTVSIQSTGDPNPANDSASTGGRVIGQLSKSAALALVDSLIVSKFPPNYPYTEYLFNNSQVSSILPAGTTVMAWDSSFTKTLADPSYLFWFDDEPNAFWTHPASYAFVNSCTGAIELDSATAWPQVDSTSSLPNTTGPDYISGETFATGDTTAAVADVESSDTECALIVLGIPLEPATETEMINDLHTARTILSDPGAKECHVSDANIVVLGDPGGATIAQVKAAIMDSFKNKNCKRFYFIYIGHGGVGDMLLAESPNSENGEGLTYQDLGNMLLAAGIQNGTFIIQACHSGSAIKGLSDSKDSKGRRLKGTVITSCASSSVTEGNYATDATPFLSKILQYLEDPNADLDRDGITTFFEALQYGKSIDRALNGKLIRIWDKENQDSVWVEANDAQGALLTGGYREVALPTPAIDKAVATNHDGTVKWLQESNPYLGTNGKAGRRRKSLWMKNFTGSPVTWDNYYIVYCQPQNVPLGSPLILALGPHETQFITDIPDSCKKGVTLSPGAKLHPMSLTGALLTEERCVAYQRGEYIFEPMLITGTGGDALLATLDTDGGLGLGISPGACLIPSLNDSETLLITGMMPDEANEGALITARVADRTSGDSAELALTVLLSDSLDAFSGADTSLVYRWIDYYGGGSFGVPSLSMQNSVINLHGNLQIVVDPGSQLTMDESALTPDSGSSYSLTVRGMLNWDNGELAAPSNGLVLDGARATLLAGGILQSGGNGLTLRGDQSAVQVMGLLVDSSMGYGVEFDSATNSTLFGIRIENSKLGSIRAQNHSTATMIDGAFDSASVSLDSTSVLTRMWTTSFLAFKDSVTPQPGVIVIVRDQAGNLLFRDTTDTSGLSAEHALAEWTMHGSSIQYAGPYSVSATNGISDTNFNLAAESRTVVLLSFPSEPESVEMPNGETASVLSYEGARPNPFDGTTTFRFRTGRAGFVRMFLCDLMGREIARPLNGMLEAGDHEVEFNAANLPAGTYFVEFLKDGVSTDASVLHIP